MSSNEIVVSKSDISFGNVCANGGTRANVIIHHTHTHLRLEVYRLENCPWPSQNFGIHHCVHHQEVHFWYPLPLVALIKPQMFKQAFMTIREVLNTP